MKYTKENIDDAVYKVEITFPYEGTEMGEMWESLISLWDRRDYIGDCLVSELENEILEQANYIEENYTLEAVEETRTVRHTVLKHIDD